MAPANPRHSSSPEIRVTQDRTLGPPPSQPNISPASLCSFKQPWSFASVLENKHKMNQSKLQKSCMHNNRRRECTLFSSTHRSHRHTHTSPSLTRWLFIWTSEPLFPPICRNPSSLRGRKLLFANIQWQKCLLTSALNISKWSPLHLQPVLWINIILYNDFVESVCCWVTLTFELKEWTTDTETSVCTSLLDSSSLHSTLWGGIWAKMPQIKTVWMLEISGLINALIHTSMQAGLWSFSTTDRDCDTLWLLGVSLLEPKINKSRT